jgi:hypothetical protein
MKAWTVVLPLMLVVVLPCRASGQVPPIVFDPYAVRTKSILHPAVGGLSGCPEDTGKPVNDIRAALGPTVRSLTVLAYDTSQFATDDALRAEIAALFGRSLQLSHAPPTSQLLLPGASVAVLWQDGSSGRLELSPVRTPFVHLTDSRGCHWWGLTPR